MTDDEFYKDAINFIEGNSQGEPVTGSERYRFNQSIGLYKNGPEYTIAGRTFSDYMRELREEFPNSNEARIENLKKQRSHALRQKQYLDEMLGNEHPDDFNNINGLIEEIESKLRVFGCGPKDWNQQDGGNHVVNFTDAFHSTLVTLNLVKKDPADSGKYIFTGTIGRAKCIYSKFFSEKTTIPELFGQYVYRKKDGSYADIVPAVQRKEDETLSKNDHFFSKMERETFNNLI